MQEGFLKGLEPIIIKRLALLIGLCYLMNPLQKQISLVIHEVSHALEIPDYVMSHSSHSSYDHESYGHLDYHVDDISHDHVIVDLFDSIFKAFNENNGTEDSLLFQTKIDKHLTTYPFQIQNYIELLIPKKLWFTPNKIESGYQKSLIEPPQYFFVRSI